MSVTLSEQINDDSRAASFSRVLLYILLAIPPLLALFKGKWVNYATIALSVLMVLAVVLMIVFKSSARKHQFALNSMLERTLGSTRPD